MVDATALRGLPQTVNWWFIIIPFLVVLIFFTIMIVFARQTTRHKFLRWWHAHKAMDVFIIKDNHFIINGVVGITDKEFMYGKHKYIIDEECIVFEKSKTSQKPVSFYFEGKPNPIKFDFKKAQADIKFSGEELKKYTDSTFVKQLLDTSMEKMMPIVLILVVIGIIVTAVGIYMQTKSTGNIEGLLRNMTVILQKR